MNLITTNKSYATYKNAVAKLEKELGPEQFKAARWLVASTPDGTRFVPTLVGMQYIGFAHVGIMVVN